MSISVQTLAVAKKYTDDSLAGAGAVAGVPCQIQSITEITGGHRVTFLWLDNNGDSHTSTMDVMNGAQGDPGDQGDPGLGIKSMAINAQAHLIITYDNDSTEDAGEVPNVQADWNEAVETADSFIKNKPTLGSAAAKNYTTNVRPGNHDLVESNAVFAAIDSALTSVYTPHGDLTCAELTSDLLIAANVGNVYTMTDSGTTSALFVNGAGITISANDSVGIIRAGADSIMFNYMGNVLDLHAYQKKELTTPLTIGGTSQTEVEGALGALNTAKADKTDLDNEIATRSTLGAHNLLPVTLEPQTYQGITYSVGLDGSISFSGSNSQAWNALRTVGTVKLPAGSYIISKAPDGAKDDATWWMQIQNADTSAIVVAAIEDEDVAFTLAAETSLNVILFIDGGYSISGTKVLYPMIRLATDADAAYSPYVPTNMSLLSDKDNGILGAKNLCPKVFSNGSHNGITYTVNSDGSITAAGTIGAGQTYSLLDSTTFTLKAGRYILSGNPVPGSGAETKRSTIRLFNGSTVIVTVDSTQEKSFVLDADTEIYVRISLNASGKTYNDVFYPMIRLITDTDNTYQPFAMTNRALTQRSENIVSFTDTIPTYGGTIQGHKRNGVVEIIINQLGSTTPIPADLTVKQDFYTLPDEFIPLYAQTLVGRAGYDTGYNPPANLVEYFIDTSGKIGVWTGKAVNRGSANLKWMSKY